MRIGRRVRRKDGAAERGTDIFIMGRAPAAMAVRDDLGEERSTSECGSLV